MIQFADNSDQSNLFFLLQKLNQFLMAFPYTIFFYFRSPFFRLVYTTIRFWLQQLNKCKPRLRLQIHFKQHKLIQTIVFRWVFYIFLIHFIRMCSVLFCYFFFFIYLLICFPSSFSYLNILYILFGFLSLLFRIRNFRFNKSYSIEFNFYFHSFVYLMEP